VARPSRYSVEFRERAVRLVAKARGEHEHEWSAITSVAAKLGVSGETVRKWVRQGEVDAGARPGTTSEESAKIHRRLHAQIGMITPAEEALATLATDPGTGPDTARSTQ
jgi:transposase